MFCFLCLLNIFITAGTPVFSLTSLPVTPSPTPTPVVPRKLEGYFVIFMHQDVNLALELTLPY